jgi:hypothetical protein
MEGRCAFQASMSCGFIIMLVGLPARRMRAVVTSIVRTISGPV